MSGHGPCAGSKGAAQGGRPPLELADIIRAHRAAYEQTHTLTPTERAVLDAVERCRTAALGGHVDVCTECGWSEPSYNSCHNRHCPKCPAVAQAKWIAARLERVLPTHYFHVVFTLPAELRGIARANRATVLRLLLRSAAATLLALGHDPKRLGGELGVTAVLHTWTQQLQLHPHVHCIVTGGALSPVGDRWIGAHPDFLFPVHVMGQLFRGKMLAALRRAARRGELRLRDPDRFRARLSRLYRKKWVVYCKRPFGGPEQVIRYLGQYTHRVALSNHRLVAMDEHTVTFRTKSGQRVTLDVGTFLSRWLSHLLPKRFVKIRHYGLMSSSHATTRLETARGLLRDTHAAPAPSDSTALQRYDAIRKASWTEVIRLLTGIDLARCPACGSRALERRPLPRLLRPRGPPKAA